MPCPICRSEFQIPKNGVAGLPTRMHDKEPAGASEQSRERYCEKHEDERIKMHCFDCKVNVCAMCCLEDHKLHNYERIEKALQQYHTSIDREIEQVTSRIEGFRDTTTQVEAEHNKTLDSIKEIKLEVKRRSENALENFKDAVQRQTNDVLRQLQSLKSDAEKQVKSHKETVQLAVREMESCRTSLLELKSKGSPSDIPQAASDVRERAKELLETYVTPSEYRAPSYKFITMKLDELLRDDQNFIGHVVKIIDKGIIMCYY